MGRKIVIGDIHGCLKTFERLLDTLALEADDQLFLVGDYVDRGPDSKGVLDKVMSLESEAFESVVLMGNHEQLFVNDYKCETEKGWFDMASPELLKSFGLPNLKPLPVTYPRFCNTLPLYYEDDDLVIVHAGFNFELDDPLSDEKSMLWIRDWYKYLDKAWLGERILVHGHTPRTRTEIRKQFSMLDKLPILNVDCGACFPEGKSHGLGYLCAYDHTHRRLYFEPNAE